MGSVRICLIMLGTSSENAGQLYTLKASIQQETPPKPAHVGKSKVVCIK